ncbi:MAG: hypothetical protein ACYDCK_01400 [Thermoplasmatota archaeon]
MTSPAPWERQPLDTDRSYEMFAKYRDLGPQRSLDRVRQNSGKGSGYMRQLERWSSDAHWVERVRAWDEEQDRVAREASARQLLEMRERHARNAMAAEEAVMIPIRKLMERFEQDPASLGGLDALEPGELLQLALAAARAHRFPVAVEMAARGAPGARDVASGDVSEDAKLLDELVARIRGDEKPKKEASR